MPTQRGGQQARMITFSRFHTATTSRPAQVQMDCALQKLYVLSVGISTATANAGMDTNNSITWAFRHVQIPFTCPTEGLPLPMTVAQCMSYDAA
jgi:hypothetical protein